MSDLEPRAKIGDVVIVSGYDIYTQLDSGMQSFKNREELMVFNTYNEDDQNTRYHETRNCLFFADKDILKNLTTNISYGD